MRLRNDFFFFKPTAVPLGGSRKEPGGPEAEIAKDPDVSLSSGLSCALFKDLPLSGALPPKGLQRPQ